MTFLGRKMIAAGLAVAALALGGCAYDDGYGYGGVQVGYGSGGYYGYDDYYGYSGYPGYGWYDGFYYPGSGYWVYDRGGRRHRWSDRQRRHWDGRHWEGRRDHAGKWHGQPHRPDRSDRGEWRGHPRTGDSDRWQGRSDRPRDGRWRGQRPDRGEWRERWARERKETMSDIRPRAERPRRMMPPQQGDRSFTTPQPRTERGTRQWGGRAGHSIRERGRRPQ